jgi:hypothetical protein
MSMATFSGPVRSGTVRYGTSATENTGLVTLSRTAYVNLSGVAVLSGNNPVAQTLFTLPAGSKILNFIPEVLVVLTGASNVGVTIGKSGSAAEFAASFNTGTAVARVTQANVDAALTGKVVALDNIGTADVPITATFTAATADATAGRVAITVVYQQRNADGSQAPAYNQN